LTFREALGGTGYGIFNNAWGAICQKNSEDEDFDEREAFADLQELADDLADAVVGGAFDDGPGSSANWVSYYCSTPARVDDAVAKLQASVTE